MLYEHVVQLCQGILFKLRTMHVPVRCLLRQYKNLITLQWIPSRIKVFDGMNSASIHHYLSVNMKFVSNSCSSIVFFNIYLSICIYNLVNITKQNRTTFFYDCTLSSTDKVAWPWLQCVPRTFPTQTSKPWSARMKPNDSSGEFRNHESPPYFSSKHWNKAWPKKHSNNSWK